MILKIKKILKIFITFCLVSFVIHLFQEAPYIRTTPHREPFPKYSAHKALVSGNHKGNTMAAIQEALASPVEGIEIDIRLSKDGVPFLYHEETLEQDTTGQGRPENYTWEELEKITYLDGSKLVRLEEVFTLVKSQKYLFLDTKTSQICDWRFVRKLSKLIHAHQLQETVIVGSFNPIFLFWMRLATKDILLMYDFTVNIMAMGEEIQAQFDKIPWALRQPFFQKQMRRLIRPDLLGVRWNLEEPLLKSLIDHGYPIICWTVDDVTVARHLFEAGVRGLQSNKPLVLMG
jgi:glycerophosphoryl diester phosphodiesterase